MGAWCRSIANAHSNIKSNHPLLSGGEPKKKGERNEEKKGPKERQDGFVSSSGASGAELAQRRDLDV